jgi:hypothetical protein
MITKHACDNVQETPWKEKIKECCEKEDPNDPRGCDCCYDSWTEELREVNTKFSEADEKARQVSMDLAYVSERRDKLKTWYDELTKAHDLSQHICDQLEIMQDQVVKITTNTQYAVDAIKILFCMIRDFYMQIDWIKTKYDQIDTCIRCLNDPVLVPGQGILKCLDDYGKKLEILIATRDELLKMVMTAIYIAYRINKNLDEEFGLHMAIGEWQITFKCDEPCAEDGGAECRYKYNQTESEKGNEEQENCNLSPRLKFPICNDPYYKEIKNKYEADKECTTELAKDLIVLNKKKESLLACKQSLKAAIEEVDPKSRCN